MIVKLNNECFIAVGNVTRDAQYKCVGDKQTPVTSFSIACGKRPDTTTIFVECKAWRDLAKVAANFVKGDSICAIGKVDEREYNGKTYKDLVCEWVWAATPDKSSAAPFPASAVNAVAALNMHDAEGDLPF